MKIKLIESVEELKREASNNDEQPVSFFIALGFYLRSTKEIVYFPESSTFNVDNLIDGIFLENISLEELEARTNIIEAIGNKTFYRE